MERYLNTGHYFNYYDTEQGGLDLFIIVNEGNYEAVDEMPMDIFNETIDLCDKYVKNRKMNNKECKELAALLEKIFPFGVQIIKA